MLRQQRIKDIERRMHFLRVRLDSYPQGVRNGDVSADEAMDLFNLETLAAERMRLMLGEDDE